MDSPTHLCNIPIRIFLWLGTCYLTTFDATLDLKCLPEYKLLQLTYELTFFFFLFTYIAIFLVLLFFFWSYVRLQKWNFLQCTLSCYKMMINIHTSMHWNLKVTPKFSPDQEHSKLISNLTASSFEFHNLNLNVNQGHAAEIVRLLWRLTPFQKEYGGIFKANSLKIESTKSLKNTSKISQISD